MKVIINQTDNYKLRLNVERVECMKDMFALTLQSQLTTSNNPTEYQTVFSTTVDFRSLLGLEENLESFLYWER
jgi:hypothetical protein